jgi:hypothetical protein
MAIGLAKTFRPHDHLEDDCCAYPLKGQATAKLAIQAKAKPVVAACSSDDASSGCFAFNAVIKILSGACDSPPEGWWDAISIFYPVSPGSDIVFTRPTEPPVLKLMILGFDKATLART